MDKKFLSGTVVVVLLVVSFLTFRSFISDSNNPYASEIAAAFLGALLTVIVTSMLLGQQTKSEEAKERNVAHFTAKLAAYQALMQTIEDIIIDVMPKGSDQTETDWTQIEKAKILLDLQCQKTIFLATGDVPDRLGKFVNKFSEVMEDSLVFTFEDDWKPISGRLAELALSMKQDLDNVAVDSTKHKSRKGLEVQKSNPLSETSHNPTISSPQSQTTQTTVQSLPSSTQAQDEQALSFTPSETNRGKFLSECEESERPYFEEVIAYCEALPDKILLEWGTKGFSLKDRERRQFLWMFPKEGANSKSNINARTQKLTDSEKSQVETILRSNGIAKGWSWRPAELPLSETKKIINLVCGI